MSLLITLTFFIFLNFVFKKIDKFLSFSIAKIFLGFMEIILFVKLDEKLDLNQSLLKDIKNQIKISLSPKHVPSIIINVNDIPKTKSGKVVELIVKKIVNYQKISNLSSLSNPECLDEIKIKIKSLN